MSAQGARAESAAQPSEGAESLLACLVRLTRGFGKPVSAAEFRSAAGSDRLTVEAALRACPRLGFKARRLPAGAQTLASLPPPFILIGADGEARLVAGREHGRLRLWDAGAEQERE